MMILEEKLFPSTPGKVKVDRAQTMNRQFHRCFVLTSTMFCGPFSSLPSPPPTSASSPSSTPSPSTLVFTKKSSFAPPPRSAALMPPPPPAMGHLHPCDQRRRLRRIPRQLYSRCSSSSRSDLIGSWQAQRWSLLRSYSSSSSSSLHLFVSLFVFVGKYEELNVNI